MFNERDKRGRFIKGIRNNPNTEFKKGSIPWNKNKKGIHLSSKTEFKKGQIAPQKGKKLTESHIIKLSKAKLGKRISPKTEFKRGMIPWNKNTKGVMKPNLTSFKKGKEHIFWNNGSSFEPYSIDWTETLRRSIRERDHYTCQICGREGYPVHHIDYDKKNNDPENLITLCKRCHPKTNHNRKFWIKYFKNNGSGGGSGGHGGSGRGK